MSPSTNQIPPGVLYLIPAPLGDDYGHQDFPQVLQAVVQSLEYFIVENEKSARRFLKRIGVSRPIAELKFGVLDEHTARSQLPALLEPLKNGRNAGLVSEAGCPCVADPGADLVALAHASGIRVKPLSGPSSILLALMASGLNGQSFVFHGYLPVEHQLRGQFLREMEKESRSRNQTQIFMDTPYRSQRLAEEVIAACDADSMFCIASDLTQEHESVRTMSIREWKKNPPALGKVPAMFLMLARRK